jgi:hypothetical protein
MPRHALARVSSKLRPLSPTVDLLEVRQLLSTFAAPTSGPVAHPMFEVGRLVSNPTVPAGAFTPAQIQQAYGFNAVSFGGVHGDGTGQTIAIVDAQDDPNIQSDLNAFDAQFGLPATTVTRVNQAGGTTYPATDSTGGWELEVALDVEWAHAMAPGAKLLLVEANSSSDSDLLAGVDYASAHANVVSMSWGGSEFSGENSAAYENHFVRAGVTFVASSGDSGAPVSWPAASPNVLAVGGTALTLGSGNSYASESGWSGSGGGPSAFETQPSYQTGVVSQTTTGRANPDVAYNASPSTGFAVYDSFNYQGNSYGWITIGGTSAGAPQWAALLAVADQGRALGSQPALDSTNSQEVSTTLYKNAVPGEFHDVTGGTSTGSPNYTAGPGYDYVTGLGSPVANLVVQSLDGTVSAPADKLTIASPTSVTAGTTFNVTVTAQASGVTTDPGYLGTVTFGSSDVQAGLPSTYTFTAADKGSHNFAVTLKTAGTQSITTTDQNTRASATASGIVVSPAAASKLVLTGLPSTSTVGASATFTVTARDPYGNVATGYTGTVQFGSSDTAAVLPASYTFASGDAGSHHFAVTFATAGSPTLTATASGLTSAQSSITVNPAAPISLKATAVSTSQINLSWTGSAGATGYTIQGSPNGSSGWSTIGTTAAGTTTFSATGLAPGTTYSFRVQATGGNGSAYSNTASATTNSVAGTVDTIWSNSFTPSQDYYSSGSYELGLKFQSSVAGNVTGARFYKQTWMNGPTHVGHLWSSTGALLATATFTNETSYGWEQVNFSNPVAISANTVYIVSFSTGGGYFGITSNFFNSTGVSNGPLQALSNLVAGGDGVYQSGNGSFPNVSGSGMNFWADVAFSPSSTATVALAAAGQGRKGSALVPLPGSIPASGATGSSSYVAPSATTTPSAGSPGQVANSRVAQAADPREETVVLRSNRRIVPRASTLAAFRAGGTRSYGLNG